MNGSSRMSNAHRPTTSNGRNSAEQLAKAREMLKRRNVRLAKEAAAFKAKNDKLEDIVKQRSLLNFELATQCNRMSSTFSNIDMLTKNCTGKLINVSNGVGNTLQICAIMKSEQQRANGEFKPSSSTQDRLSNKLNVVKPHTVNGHILYEPTINLTRVTDLPLHNQHVNARPEANEVDDTTERPFLDNNNSLNDLMDQNSTYNDGNEPSTSISQSPAQHSTVLSGTFQEVKIYLSQNNVTQREPRTSSNNIYADVAGPSGATAGPSGVTLRRPIKSEARSIENRRSGRGS